jgi:hypothetical protein
MNPNLIVPEVFEIFQGDAKVLPLRALYQGSALPFDLTLATEIVVMLPLAAAGGYLQLKLSLSQVSIVGDPKLGQFQAPISTVNSLLLQTGTFQDVFAVLTISGSLNSPFTVPFAKCFSVFE